MPAAVLPSTSSSASKGNTSKLHTQGRKKTRVVRRRGRAKHGIDSDDDIEREAATDSDSDNDTVSSDSDSDSDTEPASEDVPRHDDSSHVHIPSTSQIPPSPHAPDSLKEPLHGSVPFYTHEENDWSVMVADENENGPADLPVIDFANFNPSTIPAPSKRSKELKKERRRASKSPASAKSGETHNANEPADRSASKSGPQTAIQRRPGQTARQAYQERLESDPSYVPTVGGFWGHDDRLLDKDLRSLSGWWRGKWQGRGRGGFSARARFEQQPEFETDLTPIEKTWTHDGFEQLKKAEEKYSKKQAYQTARATRGAPPVRGHGGLARGGFNNNSARTRGASPLSPRHQPGRVWFVMKPELMWTKQHDAFLYFEYDRKNQGQNYRIKLSGSDSTRLVKAAQFARHQRVAPSSIVRPEEDVKIVVQLPRHEFQAQPPKAPESSPPPVVEEPALEEVFQVRPERAPREALLLPTTSAISSSTPSPLVLTSTVPSTPSHAPTSVISSDPNPAIRSQLEQVAPPSQPPDPIRQAQMEEAVLRNPSSRHDTPEPATITSPSEKPSLAPLQTAFTPTPPVVPQPPQPHHPHHHHHHHPSVASMASPAAYASPYPYAPLPPGIALDQRGIPYDIATGHPVYLPPATMYGAPPRSVYSPHHQHAGSGQFVPGHMHHHSHSQSYDYMASPLQPSYANGVGTTGAGGAFFTPARKQVSKVVIKAPNGDVVSSTNVVRAGSKLAHNSTTSQSGSGNGSGSGDGGDDAATTTTTTTNAEEKSADTAEQTPEPGHSETQQQRQVYPSLSHASSDPAAYPALAPEHLVGGGVAQMQYAPYPAAQYYYPQAYAYGAAPAPGYGYEAGYEGYEAGGGYEGSGYEGYEGATYEGYEGTYVPQGAVYY